MIFFLTAGFGGCSSVSGNPPLLVNRGGFRRLICAQQVSRFFIMWTIRLALFIFFLALVMSGCAPVIRQNFELLGMPCEAVEVRTSMLLTIGAAGCMRPSGEPTNLVGGTGTSAASLVSSAVSSAVTVGSSVAVGQALKGLDTGPKITINP